MFFFSYLTSRGLYTLVGFRPVCLVFLRCWLDTSESNGLSLVGLAAWLPLLLAGTFAASVPKLLALRSVGRWVPPISGVVLLTSGVLTLLARWA